MDGRFDTSGHGAMPGCVPVYKVRCDGCGTDIGTTGSLAESAAGGLCGPCRSPRCSVCNDPPRPEHLVRTGGGHDYHACSEPHAQAVWDSLDGAGCDLTPPCPWPVTNPPGWLRAEGECLADGTLDDLAAWLAMPGHAEAVRAFRGD